MDALRELADPRASLSDDARRLSDALAAPARPKTIEEAVRMHDALAMDLSALVDDTIALPFLPPSFVRPYLARNLVPLRGREARKRRLLADLRGSGLFKRRTAALAFGSWPADEAIDRALAELVVHGRDPFAIALAGCGLAAHRRLTAASGVRLARRAVEQEWDDDALGLALVGATAAVMRSRSRAARGQLVEVLGRPVSSTSMRRLQDELASHLSSSRRAGPMVEGIDLEGPSTGSAEP